jgi:UDP-2,3-diacylglucosamine pyrophosphatase LpxH
MLEVASYFKAHLDEIVILGDYADFYSVSSHQKDPRVFSMLTEEVADVTVGLHELDRLFPNALKVFIEGNHENRLERYLIKNAPALFGITSIEHILQIADRPNWKFHSYGPDQSHNVLKSTLYARHEPLGNSAKLTSARALCSLVYGHIHRIEESHIVGLDGTNHVCFSVGWLGDKRKNQVFNYVKNYWQWQMGFGMAWVDTETGLFYHQKIHILDVGGKISCVANGKLFKV